jgi:hypothetical protein
MPWEKEAPAAPAAPYKLEAPVKTSNADKFDSLFND